MNRRIATYFRRYFIAGLIVWIPIVFTVFVIRFFINLLDRIVHLIPYRYQPEQLIGFHLPGIGLVFGIFVLLITGLFATNYIGRHVITFWEKILSRIPLIRSIYSATKQVVNALIEPAGRSFRNVLLIEYPRRGVWSIAFQTSEIVSDVPNVPNTITAFIPTTPNPTTGFFVFVPQEEVIVLDMSVEEAMKMVISLGVLTPKRIRATGQ